MFFLSCPVNLTTVLVRRYIIGAMYYSNKSKMKTWVLEYREFS